MEVSDMSATLKAVLGLATLYLIYHLTTSISLWNKRRAMKQQYGVKEAPWAPQWEPFLGIELIYADIKALVEHRLLEHCVSNYKQRGHNTLQCRTLGESIHLTNEPENLKQFQAVEHKKWSLGSGRIKGFRPLLGVGIFTSDGSEWQHSRDMLRPNFVRAQVRDMTSLEHHIKHLLNAIQPNTTVDLSQLFFRLTMDSATEFLVGESTDSLSKPSTEGFADAFARSQDFIANSSRWGTWAFLNLRQHGQFKKDRDFIHSFIDKFVEKGMAKRDQLLEKSETEKDTRYVFLDELVRQTDDRVRIRSELLNILLAGRDTTASLLTNTWFMLARRPEIWTNLQAEVSSLKGALPTFEQLKDLKYLKALLNESLRFHPVVPMNSRQALEDTILPRGGGADGQSPIFIGKGELVVWNSYAMHRRKDFFGDDAEEFNPERWLDDPETGKKGLRPGWEYLPFNGGARICLGQQFALAEASYTTVRLCQTFSGIENRDPEPNWIENLTLTCVSLNGAKVALTPRK